MGPWSSGAGWVGCLPDWGLHSRALFLPEALPNAAVLGPMAVQALHRALGELGVCRVAVPLPVSVRTRGPAAVLTLRKVAHGLPMEYTQSLVLAAHSLLDITGHWHPRYSHKIEVVNPRCDNLGLDDSGGLSQGAASYCGERECTAQGRLCLCCWAEGSVDHVGCLGYTPGFPAGPLPAPLCATSEYATALVPSHPCCLCLQRSS